MSIIKKFIAVLLIAALCVSGAVFAEEAYETAMPEAAAAFEGTWQCGRLTAAVDWEEEGFRVLIIRHAGASEQTEWEYSCYYHEDDDTAVSLPFGIRTEVVLGEDGGIASFTEVYNDGEAVFSLDADGHLLWQDLKENEGEGLRFEKIPAEFAAPVYATIGEAMASDGYTGIAGGDEEHQIVVVEQDGEYVRLVADLDDEARELSEKTLDYVDADTLEAAFEAYNAHIETLPIVYAELITAAPKAQEELDALVGKTLLEAEEAGYDFSGSRSGENDEAIYTVSCGLFEYDLILNETYTEYQAHDDAGYIGDMTVKSAAFAGLSHEAAELRYRTDGTLDEENDPWAEYTALMEMITEALSSEDPEAAMQKLIEAMPEHAEEIRMFAEILAMMTEQAGE